MLIFLVGFMGCGKSTIGRRVAKRLGYGFTDMDACIERLAGKNISQIFEEDGEDAFRRMEREFLEETTAGENTIIATGGGAPCWNDNMALMKRKGKTVYFKMSAPMLFGRLYRGNYSRRPKIAGLDREGLMGFIASTLAEREHCYSQASMTIDCDGVSDEYIASHIEYFIRNCEAGEGNLL